MRGMWVEESLEKVFVKLKEATILLSDFQLYNSFISSRLSSFRPYVLVVFTEWLDNKQYMHRSEEHGGTFSMLFM